MRQQASQWAEGNFGEGYSTYAKLQGRWFSVNGSRPWVEEIRWQVSREKVIAALEEFVGNDDE